MNYNHLILSINTNIKKKSKISSIIKNVNLSMLVDFTVPINLKNKIFLPVKNQTKQSFHRTYKYILFYLVHE